MKSDEIFFERALSLASKASERNEVPIGAVLVKDGKIIAEAFNETERKSCFTAHAEMLCIERATRKLGTKYLNGCTLFLTLEPCAMCRSALRLSRVERVVYLLRSEKFGRASRALRPIKVSKVRASSLTQRAHALLQDFFVRKR